MTAGGFPHSEILGSKPCWRLPEAYRSLKRPSSVLSAKASTIRPCKQPARPIRERRETASPRQKTPLATQIITQMITHKTIKHQTPKSPAKSTAEDTPKRASPARVHYPVLKPPRTRTRAHPPHQGTGDRHGARNTSHAKRRGVAVREPKSMPAPLLDAPHDRHARRPTPLFHTSNPRAPGTSGARGHTPATRQWPEISVERR